MAGGAQVYYRKTAVAESNPCIRGTPQSGIVWPSVLERVALPAQNVRAHGGAR
jgi:hypothetical protein